MSAGRDHEHNDQQGRGTNMQTPDAVPNDARALALNTRIGRAMGARVETRGAEYWAERSGVEWACWTELPERQSARRRQDGS